MRLRREYLEAVADLLGKRRRYQQALEAVPPACGNDDVRVVIEHDQVRVPWPCPPSRYCARTQEGCSHPLQALGSCLTVVLSRSKSALA